MQRDFIKGLQDFIKIAREFVPLERSVKELSLDLKKRTVVIETKIKEVEYFESNIITAVEGLIKNSGIPELIGIQNEILAANTSGSSRTKIELNKQLQELTKTTGYEIEQIRLKMLSILNPLFTDGIYSASNTYSLLSENKVMKGKQLSSTGNMGYEFDLEFTANRLKVEDLSALSLPVWVSGGLLHHEDKVKKMDVSDYIILSIEYNGDEHLEVVFSDDDSKNVFKIIANEKVFTILHNGQDLTIDETLSESLDEDEVSVFITKLKQYFYVAVKSKQLMRVLFEGNDAIYSYNVFECLKIIAVQYGNMIKDCLEKGYNKEEIAIKIEMSDGTRTEKYMSNIDAFKQLSAIGSEGLELAKLMNVLES